MSSAKNGVVSFVLRGDEVSWVFGIVQLIPAPAYSIPQAPACLYSTASTCWRVGVDCGSAGSQRVGWNRWRGKVIYTFPPILLKRQKNLSRQVSQPISLLQLPDEAKAASESNLTPGYWAVFKLHDFLLTLPSQFRSTALNEYSCLTQTPATLSATVGTK